MQDWLLQTFEDLEWFPSKKRVIFKILLLTYKCANNLSPKYLCELLSPRKCPRPLRSDSLLLLEPLKIRLKSYGYRSFPYGAVLEWNMLPLHIRQPPSVKIFKVNVKTYLFVQNSKHYNWNFYHFRIYAFIFCRLLSLRIKIFTSSHGNPLIKSNQLFFLIFSFVLAFFCRLWYMLSL